MAWESRGNSLYYYRKHREGDTVYSEYVGTGEVALLVAKLDEFNREEDEEARWQLREEMELERDLDRQIDTLGAMVRDIRNAILLSSGFHTHKGQWRRQHGED